MPVPGAAGIAGPQDDTGLPGQLKWAVESLSGASLDSVKVHYNSAQPAQLDALAYTKGAEIHVGPGQEDQLAHEAWHVVQQVQGRVQPTSQLKGGVPVNDDRRLEKEADGMGARASAIAGRRRGGDRETRRPSQSMHPPVQRTGRANGGHQKPLSAARIRSGSPDASSRTSSRRYITVDSALEVSASLPSPALTAATADVVQRRGKIPVPPDPVTLRMLEQAAQQHVAEIGEFVNDEEEQRLGVAVFDDLERWRLLLAERLRKAGDAVGPDDVFSREQVAARTGPADFIYLVMITLANIRGTLNSSLDTAAEIREGRRQEQLDISKKSAVKKDQEARKLQKQAAAREPHLGNKWGKYNDQLKYENESVFRQHVPADAESIRRALKSQDIRDAVYHKDKAFWVAAEGFALADIVGKTEMRYHFSPEGARSLMEDFLICASGDFANDNEQDYSGETSCPLYTLWKTNEIGAYGIGSLRLGELAPFVTHIEAFGADGKQIMIDMGGKKT